MTKKKIVSLAAYCVPWMFVMLYGDVSYGWFWQYLAIFGLLAVFPLVFGSSAKVLAAGNLLTMATSLLLVYLSGFGGMNGYFKPFGAGGWTVILWLISGLLQWLVWKRQWLLLALLAGFAGLFLGSAWWLQLTM